MEIIDIIYKISALVFALATIVLTFYIYKLSTINNKKDSYLQNIVDLYYRIEEDSCLLFENFASKGTDESTMCKRYSRRISVNCTLMVYYIKRYPGYYKDRGEFERLLINITEEPTNKQYYDSLSSQFEKFCWGIKRNKKYASRYIFSLKKDGYPDENCD